MEKQTPFLTIGCRVGDRWWWGTINLEGDMFMSKYLGLLVMVAVLSVFTSTATAATWNNVGNTSETQQWTDAANWGTGDVPDVAGEVATIISSPLEGDRNIEVTGTNVIDRLEWTVDGSFEDRITLNRGGGTCLQTVGGSSSAHMVNNSGDPANMVMALNGNTWNNEGFRHFPSMTLLGPGTLDTNNKLEWGGNNVVVGPKVVIRSRYGGFNNNPQGTAWDPTSRLIIDTGNEGPWTGDGTIGHVDIINGGAWSNNATYTVAGDINIDVTSSINKAGLQDLRMMGDFIDNNPSGSVGAGGKYRFQSNGTQRVKIPHANNSYLVVEGTTRVELHSDYTGSTSTGVDSWIGGTLDLGRHTVDVGRVTFDSPTLVFGDQDSLIETDYLVHMNTIVIEIENIFTNTGFTSGSDLVLIDYADRHPASQDIDLAALSPCRRM